MNKNDEELKQYFKAIKKETHVYTNSSRFLKDLKDEIYSYISNNPNISMEDIYREYGTSTELASEFFRQTDEMSYKKKLSFTNHIKKGIAVCFILFIILLLLLFIDRQINRPVTVEYNIETGS